MVNVSNLLLGLSVFSCALLLPSVGYAADLEGPPGWTRTDVPSPTQTRTIATWQIAGDTSTSLTLIVDSSISYYDTMTAMNKNFTDNAIRLSTNRDRPCQGTIAHEVEFTAGPDAARSIFNRLVVPVGAGVATITYTRAEGNAFEADVRKAELAFCAQTPEFTPEPGTPVPIATVAPTATPKSK